MKKIFVLFNPYTLGFDQMTRNLDPDYIREITNPDPNDVDRAKTILEEIKERFKNPLGKVENVQFSIIRNEILPYPFAYEIRDTFEDYETRRDWFLKSLLPTDPGTHHALSHNKLRKRRIESVLNYTKIFGSKVDRVLLSQIEVYYKLENPYEFQKSLDEEKSQVIKMVTRLALSVMEKALIQDKIMVI